MTMKFKIHGTWPDGTEDSITITGETVEEIREKADEATSGRDWADLWSEEVTS